MIKVLRHFLSLFSKYVPPFLKQRTVSIVSVSVVTGWKNLYSVWYYEGTLMSA